MEIFLVRHGEAASSWGESPDPGLSELGLRQAVDVATQLRQLLVEPVQMISSPLQRAKETAAPLSRLLRQGVREDEAFREIPSPVPLAQWSEQGADLQAWRGKALGQLMELRQSAVIFTHFLVINAVVGHVLDRPQTLCFWPDNGSVTRLRLTGSSLELVTLGSEMETPIN